MALFHIRLLSIKLNNKILPHIFILHCVNSAFLLTINTKIKIVPSVHKGRIFIRILVTCLYVQRTKNDAREGHLLGIIGTISSHFNKVSLIFGVDRISTLSTTRIWLLEVNESSRLYREMAFMYIIFGNEDGDTCV